MESNFISAPRNSGDMEGNSVDYRKTFNLNGTDNDEMLRLYLRKAGLSDQIERLTPEQRRAFIYDIIKSNKMPGYWLPSTMKTSAFNVPPPAVRPPPPPTRSATSSPYTERKQAPTTPTIHYATMSSSSSTSSLQSSPILPRRFVAAPTTPPSPSTFVTNSRGAKYEISGPMNFQHVAGDLTRDMTRNAFDLSMTMNDNVLKKYMIEKGITEEDVSGMRKQDLIRNIVQSKFTWLPPKRNVPQNLVYATISKNNETPLPPVAATATPSLKSSPTPSPFSNFTFVASRFADVSEFPSPDDLFGSTSVPQQVALPPLPPQAVRPAPPPRKTHAALPPPSAVKATTLNSSELYQAHVKTEAETVYETIESIDRSAAAAHHSVNTSIYCSPAKADSGCYVMPPHIQTAVPAQALQKRHNSMEMSTPPPPPPLPAPVPIQAPQKQSNSLLSPTPPPPPPPPMPLATKPSNNIAVNHSSPPTLNAADPRDAFLESIRNGVALKKVNQKAATISGVKPRVERKPPAMDFLSELKMGLTLRRVKNQEDNPFAGGEPDESHA